MHKTHVLTLLLVTSLVVLVNCGGGGGGGDAANPSPDTDINDGITGQMFIGSEEEGPWIMDFSTGRYAPIPGVLWEDNPDYHFSADFSAYPADDALEFVETIEQCEFLGGFDYEDCLVIHDSQGGVVTTLKVPYETNGPARFSADRQFIAVPIQNPSSSLNPRQLTLFTRAGVQIDASNEDVAPRNFDWLPDNRLVYASGQALYTTDVGSAQGSVLITIPANAGEPRQLAVSPDGTQLAFTLVTFDSTVSTHGTTWVLNLDGSRFVRLTNTPDANDPGTATDDPVINFPTWSPDGRWIAVIEGGISGAIAPVGSTKGDLYVVPSDGEEVMLTQDQPTTAQPIYSYFEETMDFVSDPELSTRFNVYHGGLAWLP